MKNSAKKIFVFCCVFILGAITGATILFYSTRDLPARLMIRTMQNQMMYNVSNNTRVLFHLRRSETENAIEMLENDLDTDIITLNSIQNDNEFISNEEKDKIKVKLKYAKKYRLNYPRKHKNLKIGTTVEDALSEISTD